MNDAIGGVKHVVQLQFRWKVNQGVYIKVRDCSLLV